MATDGFFSLGQAVAGGDPRIGEDAFLEGLDTGSRINARRASTESALALARQRRDENVARAKLSEEFPEFAPLLQAGVDPRQVTGARSDQQISGFRDTVADVNRPFGERQAAAQATSGTPLKASDFLGPSGELFTDIFSEPSEEGFVPTQTGAAQIDFDTQRARLAEEKRLHPERFKSGTTINIGEDGSLSEVAAPSVTLPENFDPGLAFGAPGTLGEIANVVSDVLPFVPQFFPNVNQMQTAVETVRNQTLNTKVLEFPGRPTNFVAQEALKLFPESGSAFQGPEDALQKLNQLKTTIDSEIAEMQRLLPQLETKANRDKGRATLSQFQQLSANYSAFIEAFENTANGNQQGLPDLNQLQPGESVQLNGMTITKDL